MSDNAQAQNNAPVFAVVRLYAKDCSLEAPNSPEIFITEGKPDTKVEFQSIPRELPEHNYEVDLRVTVTAKVGEKVAFICEVHQAGIFKIEGFDDATLEFLLNGVAPNTLFPYAAEHLSSLINRGSFPPFHLQPINFENIYRSQKAREAAQAQSDVANGAQSGAAPQA